MSYLVQVISYLVQVIIYLEQVMSYLEQVMSCLGACKGRVHHLAALFRLPLM
jgi:hypothetical protein